MITRLTWCCSWPPDPIDVFASIVGEGMANDGPVVVFTTT